jgi:hypothetical protein
MLILVITLSMIMVSQNSFVKAEDFKISQEKYDVGHVEEIDIHESNGNGQEGELPNIEELLQQNENIMLYKLPEKDNNGEEIDKEYLQNYYKNQQEELSKKPKNQNNIESNRLRNFCYDISFSSKFPFITRQYGIYFFANKNFTPKIVNNELEEISYEFCGKRIIIGWLWQPTESGIFKIAFYDSEGMNIGEKKVYVNTFNDEYLQFKRLQVNGSDVKAILENTNEFKGYNNVEMTVCIGEANYWRRTLRKNININELKDNEYTQNYNDNNFNDNYFEEDEYDQKNHNHNFELKSGNYKVGAFLKNSKSIEWEDAKFIDYRVECPKNLNLTLTAKENDKKCNESIETSVKYKSSPKLTFTADVIGKDTKKDDINNVDTSKYEYAFLLNNENGTKVIQGYGNGNMYNTENENKDEKIFNKPGKYVIYARVREKGKYNSYFAQKSFNIEIENSEPPIEVCIEEVKIKQKTCCMGCKTYELRESNDNEPIKSHESYIIGISAVDGEKCNLQYKAYALHDGYCYALCEYTKSNEIPFYPKSQGDYKIIVLVKHSNSGSEDARKEYMIKVQ